MPADLISKVNLSLTSYRAAPPRARHIWRGAGFIKL